MCSSDLGRRGARWPLPARWRGGIRRLLGNNRAPLPDNRGLIVPEIFSPAVAAALPSLFAAAGGPRVAIFHDAIALRLPDGEQSGTAEGVDADGRLRVQGRAFSAGEVERVLD